MSRSRSQPRRRLHFVQYWVDERRVVEPFDSYGSAAQRARSLQLEGTRFVAIYDVDPRVWPDARPVGTRLG